MAGEKTRSQLQKELNAVKNSNERFIVVANVVGTIVVNIIRWGAIVAIVYYGTQAVGSLAGLQTNANIAVTMLSSVTISNGLAYALAGGGLLWGYSERKLRQRTVKHVHSHTKELERRIDPARSSSSLTETGQTNPDDAGEFGKE